MPQCRSCGDPVIWIETQNGKKHPVDTKPEKRWIYQNEIWSIVDTYTSHFTTCPDGKDWSGHGSSEATG
jgi:hypothetical protein